MIKDVTGTVEVEALPIFTMALEYMKEHCMSYMKTAGKR